MDGRSRFLVFWGVTIATVAGPWLLLRHGPALLIGSESPAAAGAVERLQAAVDAWYLWGLGAYLAAAWFLSPSWDPDRLGLFGSSRIDDPFSHEDDWNRTKRKVAFLLVPGKIVWATLGETWRRLGGRAGDA